MKRRLLLFKSISLIVVALVMLTGITFAWFTPYNYINRIQVKVGDKKFRFDYYYLEQTEEERSSGVLTEDPRDPSAYTKITDSDTNEPVPSEIVNMTMIPGSSEYFMIDMLMTEATYAALHIDFIQFQWMSESQIYLDYLKDLEDKLSVHIHIQVFKTDGVTIDKEEDLPVKYMLKEIVASGGTDGDTFRLLNYSMHDGMKVRVFYEVRLSGEAVKTEITSIFKVLNLRFSVT